LFAIGLSPGGEICGEPADSNEGFMAEQGSTGNVIAALASFFIPGLGQLIQGRPIVALVHFLLAAALWWILMGWVIHLWSIIDAARWKGP
jgi:TM2 domain-containing membrane protein YozV